MSFRVKRSNVEIKRYRRINAMLKLHGRPLIVSALSTASPVKPAGALHDDVRLFIRMSVA